MTQSICIERLTQIVLWIPLLFGCARDSGNEAKELLHLSIQYHGGTDRYNAIAELSYTKTTILYDSGGSEESRITQQHHYRFDKQNSGSIRWEQNGRRHVIDYLDGGVKVFINDTLQSSQDAIDKGLQLVTSSHFVLMQPFKLADEGIKLSLDHTRTPLIEQKHILLCPKFPDDSNDHWKFAIEPFTGKVIANLVEHNGRISFIENLSFHNVEGLILHKHRKSYFTDAEFKKSTLRAEYFYENYRCINR